MHEFKLTMGLAGYAKCLLAPCQNRYADLFTGAVLSKRYQEATLRSWITRVFWQNCRQTSVRRLLKNLVDQFLSYSLQAQAFGASGISNLQQHVALYRYLSRKRRSCSVEDNVISDPTLHVWLGFMLHHSSLCKAFTAAKT
jgi:hypothetical protein